MARKSLRKDIFNADELITPDQLAETLGVSKRTLANWRSLELGPHYVKIGGRVRYRTSSVNDWIETQEQRAAAS